ncbi:hypothetical protein GCM10010452_84380 [Crossiella cryophila]
MRAAEWGLRVKREGGGRGCGGPGYGVGMKRRGESGSAEWQVDGQVAGRGGRGSRGARFLNAAGRAGVAGLELAWAQCWLGHGLVRGVTRPGYGAAELWLSGVVVRRGCGPAARWPGGAELGRG